MTDDPRFQSSERMGDVVEPSSSQALVLVTRQMGYNIAVINAASIRYSERIRLAWTRS